MNRKLPCITAHLHPKILVLLSSGVNDKGHKRKLRFHLYRYTAEGLPIWDVVETQSALSGDPVHKSILMMFYNLEQFVFR